MKQKKSRKIKIKNKKSKKRMAKVSLKQKDNRKKRKGNKGLESAAPHTASQTQQISSNTKQRTGSAIVTVATTGRHVVAREEKKFSQKNRALALLLFSSPASPIRTKLCN